MARAVLFISAMNGDPWGGSEAFWHHLAIWMAKQGHKVGCCYFEWPSGKAEKINELQEAGCHLYPLPNPKQARNPLQKMMTRNRGARLLKKTVAEGWDLVCISQGGYEDVTHRPLRGLYSQLKKYVLIYHNYNERHRLSANRTRNLQQWINGAALNMVASHRIGEGVQKASGLELPRLFTLCNPLTIPYQPEPAPWPGLDKQGLYVWTMLAQLDTARKAQDVLVRALATSKWKERNWVLYLYGGGEDRSLLENLIQSLGMQDQVKLMGHTRDVQPVLRQTHLLLQITHIDAMPLSVTEAMNMARPCVVSRVGDMPLWVQHGKNGYIAPAATEPDIDTVLEQAWAEKADWQQLGLEAHRVFLEKYPRPYEEYYTALLLNL